MAKNGSFGLKEVADVRFYPVGTAFTYDGGHVYATDDKVTWDADAGEYVKADGATKLFEKAEYVFDSLKVSNIEFTSDDTSARGGKGNPELLSWSYNKAATLTIEDALMSLDTFDLMFGGKESDPSGFLTIDAKSFPGAYTIVGETVMRSYVTGEDKAFSFVLAKGQPNVSGTLTLEAEGDPSTFEMTIKALAGDIKVDNAEKKDVLIEFFSASDSGSTTSGSTFTAKA